MRQSEVIDLIADSLRDVLSIRTLFLSGSHGNGMADDCSDIDFVLIADDGANEEVAETWRKAVSRTGEIVLWSDRTVRPAIINAITEEWTRTDVVILKPDQMGLLTKNSLKPLFITTAFSTVCQKPPSAKAQILDGSNTSSKNSSESSGFCTWVSAGKSTSTVFSACSICAFFWSTC